MLGPGKALLDANVLYSNHLRNLLLQMAQNDLFEARWSAQIEQEWLRNTEQPTRGHIEVRTLPLIRRGFPGALVTGFDFDRVTGTTDVKDRHVASAAAAIAPCVLVTHNRKDFDAGALNSLGVALQIPDEFLTALFDSKPDVVEAVTREAAANLTRTRPSWDEYLNLLARRCNLPNFIARLRSLGPSVSSAAPEL